MRVFMTLAADNVTPSGFYPDDIHPEPPENGIEITTEQWIDAITNQGRRHWNGLTSSFDEYDPPPSAIPVPAQVSNYQARTILIKKGIFSKVDAALRGADQTVADNQIALQAWDYANNFYRDSPFVKAMASMLKMSDSDIDNMFIAAASIV